MNKSKASYEELKKKVAKLESQLSEIENIELIGELTKKNAQLNEYNEELKQMLETIKLQNEELEKIRSKFRLLESNIADVIWMMNLKGDLTYVSLSAIRVFGYSESEIEQIDVRKVLTKESFRLHRAHLASRLEKEKNGEITGPFSSILQHVRKNGEIFWAEVSSNPLRGSKNRIIGLVGVTRDITSRVKDEEEIEKLSVAVEQNPASIVITDTNGTIEYVNATFTNVTGYSYEEALGKNPRILKSGKVKSELYEKLWKTILSGKVWRGELINKKKNGEHYWERVIISPIKNKEEKIVKFVAIKENVTAQKKAEQQLIDSQERYKLLSDISLEGVILTENDLIVDINSSVSRITGFSPQDLVGKETIKKLFTPTSVDLIRKNLESQVEYPFEVTGLRKNKTTYPAEIELRQYNYRSRNLHVKALRDITYRKRVEDVLRTSLKMNELVAFSTEKEIIQEGLEEAVRLSESSIGFFHFVNDDQKTITLCTWSKATIDNCLIPDKLEHYPISRAGTWTDCFYTREPVIHNDYKSLKHKKGLPEGHFPLKRYISLPVIEDNKVKIIFGVGNKNHDYNQFDVDILSLLAKTIWMVIQRKRTERKLRESNASKDKFFSIISHDLRSPIGTLQTLTEVLSENYEDFSEEEIKNSLKAINGTVSSTYKLLENILLWSLSHRDKIEFLPQKFWFNQIYEQVVRVAMIDADKKNIKINYQVEDGTLIWGDINMINTILRNLISNAIKFTPKGGEITISSSRESDSDLMIYVKDSGVGIPPELLDKLFKIDENVTTKGTENEKGTGLGLILCQEFVERHGGKIWVESEVNKGTIFKFTLPTESI